MSRTVRYAGVQAEPRPIGASLEGFAADVTALAAAGNELVIYPELHLFSPDHLAPELHTRALRDASVPLDDPFVARLGEIAREANVWLLPGSICERGPSDELFNTALVFSPGGELVAHYRKIFPWRPSEPYDPGDRFVVFDVTGVGRFGLSICYDSWYPELSRHLGWMGAEVVLNIVKTTTPDRAQELVLARANSIVNQTFTLSVNCAAPIGKGRSIIVDPEGAVLHEAGEAPTVISDTIDLDEVTRVREVGTAGVNRMWSQFLPSDAAITLPLYNGRIDPATWHPQSTAPNEEVRQP